MPSERTENKQNAKSLERFDTNPSKVLEKSIYNEDLQKVLNKEASA